MSSNAPNIKVELAGRSTATGYGRPRESSREYNIVSDASATIDQVYAALWNAATSNGTTTADEWSNPIDENGVSVEVQDASGRLWKGRVQYRTPDDPDGGESADNYVSDPDNPSQDSPDFLEQSFSTTGSTSRRFFIPCRVYDSNGNWQYNENAYNEDGVDVVTPALTMTFERRFPNTALAAVAAQIAEATGSVNAKIFQGFAVGTVLFTGCSSGQLIYKAPSGNVEGYRYWKVLYNFAVSPAVWLPTNGQAIPKNGWEAYWTDWGATNSGVDLVHKVGTVYKSYDFSRLGIF